MKKKTKPATAGEKIVMLDTALPIGVVRDTPEIRMVAYQIDRAIARAVRKERERCVALIANARDSTPYSALSKVTISRVLCSIEEGEQL